MEFALFLQFVPFASHEIYLKLSFVSLFLAHNLQLQKNFKGVCRQFRSRNKFNRDGIFLGFNYGEMQFQEI